MTTAEAVVETLLRHGIDTLYGVPGVHNDPLFDACYKVRDRLRVIHTRHEQAAAYMALGAALITGKPQVCAVVPGPGLLNAGAALLTAHGMSAPVLVLAGQIVQRAIDRGTGYLHEIRDQAGMARHFTKSAARINAPHEAPGTVAAAIRTSLSGKPGPVFVECAQDTWAINGPVVFPPMPEPVATPPVDDDAVEAAAQILGLSERPLIIVGGGAQDASAEVIALAELLEAPVAAYRRGQGVMPATHRLHVNLPIAHRLWRDADAAITVGSRMFYPKTQWGTTGLRIVRIDIDPDEPGRQDKPAAALVGDAKAIVGALLQRLPAHNRPRPSREAELASHREWMADRFSRFEPQISLLKAMRSALPENGVFVDEVTQLGFAARLAFPVLGPRRFLSPGYQDNLGWGYGAALGVKAARPDLPVLAIAGDGGFMYQVAELATAVQHNLAVVVVVFDNGMFGNVHLIQDQSYGGRHIADRLRNPDFVALARSFGIAAFRADDAHALERTLREAFAVNAPALVHVPCGEMPSPWDMIFMPKVR